MVDDKEVMFIELNRLWGVFNVIFLKNLHAQVKNANVSI
jgi:hypothetical protein